MSQNRNKLIALMVGNLSNAIVHTILERAIDEESIRSRYDKELRQSLEIAKRYREKINPMSSTFTEEEGKEVYNKVLRKVTAELKQRIERGYENIDLNAVEKVALEYLKELKVI